MIASWTTRRIFIMSNIMLLPKLQYLIFGISMMIYLSVPAYEFALIDEARCGLCGGQKGKRDAHGEGRQGLDEAGTRGLSTASPTSEDTDTFLNHWGWVMHICVIELGRHLAVNAGTLLIGPLGTNYNGILIKYKKQVVWWWINRSMCTYFVIRPHWYT